MIIQNFRIFSSRLTIFVSSNGKWLHYIVFCNLTKRLIWLRMLTKILTFIILCKIHTYYPIPLYIEYQYIYVWIYLLPNMLGRVLIITLIFLEHWSYNYVFYLKQLFLQIGLHKLYLQKFFIVFTIEILNIRGYGYIILFTLFNFQ